MGSLAAREYGTQFTYPWRITEHVIDVRRRLCFGIQTATPAGQEDDRSIRRHPLDRSGDRAAVQVRHSQIRDDDLERSACLICEKNLESATRVICGEDFVSIRLADLLQRRDHRARRLIAWWGGCCPGRACGNVSTKRVPSPGVLCTLRVAACLRTTPYTIAKPNSVPRAPLWW